MNLVIGIHPPRREPERVWHVGLLALDRQSRTLSGGEVQRINLTTALGTSLVNTLFVLDEPAADERTILQLTAELWPGTYLPSARRYPR